MENKYLQYLKKDSYPLQLLQVAKKRQAMQLE